jgi:outer membrane protein TolC
MNKLVIAISAVLAAQPLYAQPPGAHAHDDDGDGPEARSALPITIDELVEVAVRLSPDLARAKIDRVAARAAAEGQGRNQAWVLTSTATYSRSATNDSQDVAPFAVVAEDSIGGSIGLGRNLPTGGSLSVELGAQHTTSEYNIVTGLTNPMAQVGVGSGSAATATAADDVPYEKSTTSLKATFKQPILRGFGPDVALAPQRKADLAASEATIKAQLAAEEMLKDIVTAYWELAYASFEVDTRQQALDLAHKQEQITHDQMRAGAAPSSALDSVTYELATREEALLRAQLVFEQKSLELRLKAGLELDKRQIVLRPNEPFQIGPEEFDVDEILERSHQANRQLATLQLEKKSADVDVDVAQDGVRPQLDFTVSGALVGYGDNAGASLSGIGQDAFQVTAGLQFSVELSGAARRQRDSALAKRRRLDVDRADLIRQIDTQVVTAVHTVTAARTRVALADRAILVAEEEVRTERASFLANRTTNHQVLQRQTALVEARLKRGRAIADYHEALVQLQFLSGLLLEQYRVNVHPRAERS